MLPGADVQLVQQVVELADEVGRAVSPRHGRLPLRQEPRQPVPGRAGQAEEPLVFIEQRLLGYLPSWAEAVPPFDVAQPRERLAEEDGLGLVEQARAATGLDRDAECGELLHQARIGGATPHQDRDVAEPGALVRKVEDHVGDPARLLNLGRGIPDHDLWTRAFARRPVRCHGFVDPLRYGPGKLIGDLDDLRSAPPVDRDLERLHWLIPARGTVTMLETSEPRHW